MNWEKKNVTVQNKDGPEIMELWCLGMFAVKPFEAQEAQYKVTAYGVTHVATGWNLGVCRTKRAAFDAIVELNTNKEWDDIQADNIKQKIVNFPDSCVKQFKELRRFFI